MEEKGSRSPDKKKRRTAVKDDSPLSSEKKQPTPGMVKLNFGGEGTNRSSENNIIRLFRPDDEKAGSPIKVNLFDSGGIGEGLC